MRYRVIIVHDRGELGVHECNLPSEVTQLFMQAMMLDEKLLCFQVIRNY